MGLAVLLCSGRASAQPANDDCATPTVIAALPFADTLDTTAATTAGTDPTHSCTLLKNAHSVWYSFTAPGNGAVTADTFGTGFDTALTAYTGTCGALTEIACNDDSGSGLQSKVSFAVTAGVTYLIEVTGLDVGDSGTLDFALAAAASPSNDECATPKVPAAIPFHETLDTSEATASGSDPAASCTGGRNSASVWYLFTPPAGGTVMADTFGSNYDTVLAAYTGTCGALSEIACDDDSGDDVQSQVSFAVTGGVPYLIEVMGYGTGGGGALDFTLTFVSDASLADPVAAKAADKCQKAIKKAGSTFVAKRLGILEKCAGGLFKCVQTVEAGAKQDACVVKAGAKCTKGFGKLPAVVQKFTASLTAKCDVDVLNADFATTILGNRGLGYGALDGECYAEAGSTLASVQDVAICLAGQHACRAEKLFEAQEPRARELIDLPLAAIAPGALANLTSCLVDHSGAGAGVADKDAVGKPLEKCQTAIRKAGAKFVLKKLKSLELCVDTIFTCLQTKPADPVCVTEKARGKCEKEFVKIDSEANKLRSSIDKKCAGELIQYDTLRQADAANLDALAAECPRFGVPAPSDLEEYKLCILQQHDCRVEELLRFEAPRARKMIESLGLDPPPRFPSDFCPTPTPAPTPGA